MDNQWNMRPNKALARQLAIRDIPSLVYEAVNLEGIAMTLPEVQTILDGITVGGHKVSDQNIVINQAETWRHLFALLDKQRFAFSKQVALELHQIAAKKEAFAWGCFRSGEVTISGSDFIPPAASDLDRKWQELEVEIQGITDIYDKAIFSFLQMARNQFFWDVNKRMGRFMMNGILLDEGYPIINVPVKKQLEFNTLMLDFYASNNEKEMNHFLRSCLDERIINNFR